MLAGLFACKPNLDEFTPSKGDADFTRYLSLGDQWTSGFADGALYKSGQEHSYPALLAGQFSFAGGGAFKQPLMLDDYGIGFSPALTLLPKLVLGYGQDCLGQTSLSPILADEPANPANLAPIGDPNPYNNIGIPGLKSIHTLVPGYGALGVGNPYYARFASSQQAKVLDEIPRMDATFFTLHLGTYDVLDYARTGGKGALITSQEQFTAAFSAALTTLTANGAKGAVATVPYVLDAPFFHTIPYNALVLTEQAQVDALRAGYAQLNFIINLNGGDTLYFDLGPNPLVIEDTSLPWGRRQMKEGELVLLSVPQDSLKCGGWGSQDAIPDAYILTEQEVINVRTAVIGYNTAIKGLVQDKPVALVDLYSKIGLLNAGLTFDGITLTPVFVTGNMYSLDGMNPTPMGSAVIANYFIDAINETFNANLSRLIISDYPAVVLP